MTVLFDPKAGKKAVNLSVNEELLRLARELGINLSQTLEGALDKAVRETKAKVWAEENKDAIETQRRWIEKHGMWHDGLRQF